MLENAVDELSVVFCNAVDDDEPAVVFGAAVDVADICMEIVPENAVGELVVVSCAAVGDDDEFEFVVDCVDGVVVGLGQTSAGMLCARKRKPLT